MLLKTGLLLLALLSSFSTVSSQAEEGVQTVINDDLNALIRKALEINPEIKASEARWRMLTHKVQQAGALDDPMLMFGINNGLAKEPFDLNRETATSKVIGISQMLPYFGKRALKREIAEHDAEAVRWQVEERRLELATMVRETWYRLYFIDQSLDVLDRSIATLNELVSFTESMYGVGQGTQADVLRAQVERSRMEEMRLVLQQQRRSLEATLNTLLYQPSVTPVPKITDLELTDIPLDQTTLEKKAEEHRPLLRNLEALIGKARIERSLADREFYPDFTLAFEYMQRDPVLDSPGDDMYNATVSFNIPLQRERRHAMIAESEAAQRMASEELNLTRNKIQGEIADLVSQIERDRNMATLYREGIMPQAGAVLESSLAAYRAAKADFMQVLDSQMALFNIEREYHKVVAEHQMAVARLESTVGTPLSINP